MFSHRGSGLSKAPPSLFQQLRQCLLCSTVRLRKRVGSPDHFVSRLHHFQRRTSVEVIAGRLVPCDRFSVIAMCRRENVGGLRSFTDGGLVASSINNVNEGGVMVRSTAECCRRGKHGTVLESFIRTKHDLVRRGQHDEAHSQSCHHSIIVKALLLPKW